MWWRPALVLPYRRWWGAAEARNALVEELAARHAPLKNRPSTVATRRRTSTVVASRGIAV